MGFEQCFRNRTGHQIEKVIDSRFTGRTGDIINI